MFCDIIYILVKLNKDFSFIIKKDIEFYKLVLTEYNIIIFYIRYNYKKLSRSITIDIWLKKNNIFNYFPAGFIIFFYINLIVGFVKRYIELFI
jgi:hypothetical protein